MTLEFSKEALQAALAELLLATVSELNKRKHPGWAYCVYTKATLQGSLSTLHLLIDDDMSQSEYNQLMVDAGLLKKPKQTSHAHGVSKDNWEAFCANHSIKYCEANVMNSCTINTWEIKRESVFLRLGGTSGINPKEQIYHELNGSTKAPKLRSPRFLEAKNRLKHKINHDAKIATTPTPLSNSNPVQDNKNAHLGEKRKSAAIEAPPPWATRRSPAGGTTKSPADGTSKGLSAIHTSEHGQITSVSYILTWGETTGAVLARFGGLVEKEIDQSELAVAVEAMKATLNACSIREVKRENLETTRHEQPSTKTTASASIPSNCLKRPANPTSILERQSTIKRTRIAEDEDSTLEKTISSPTSKVIKGLYPRLGKNTLESRQSRILNWSEGTAALDSSSNAPTKAAQNKAETLAYLVHAGASGNPALAAETVVRMLDRVDCHRIRENVRRILRAENHELNVDRVIANGLVEFIQHHHTRGQRSKDAQNAIDAILTAACFALPADEAASHRQLASRIFGDANASAKLTRHKNKALEMIGSGSYFSPKERKTRSDAYKEEAASCVSNFCHSKESSRLGTESYRCIKVKDPITNLSEPHPLRVWNEVTLDARYASFSQSNIYRRWQRDNGDKTIGFTSFRAHVCPCVRDPTPESCVDLVYLQCHEYMVAIRNALRHRPSL